MIPLLRQPVSDPHRLDDSVGSNDGEMCYVCPRGTARRCRRDTAVELPVSVDSVQTGADTRRGLYLCSQVRFVHSTPVSALRFVGVLYEEAGLPAEVSNIATDGSSTAGETLINHGKVDKLAFVGSTGVGRHIGKAADGSLISVSLELGGEPQRRLPECESTTLSAASSR